MLMAYKIEHMFAAKQLYLTTLPCSKINRSASFETCSNAGQGLIEFGKCQRNLARLKIVKL